MGPKIGLLRKKDFEMGITIPDAVNQMLHIVKQLQSAYPKKRFTLDGRLVGDLGEILVEDAYDVELYENLQEHHDGITSDGRKVQIKATMQNSLTFPADHVPDYYLGIKIHPDGTFTEVFNGPGAVAWEAVRNRQPTKTNLHSIPISTLTDLKNNVKPEDRILRRNKEFVQATDRSSSRLQSAPTLVMKANRHEMSFADYVRRYCKENYIDPARARGEKTVTIRSGDVHSALNYRNRYPLVCSAIGSNLFEELCSVKRISVEGPLNGVSTLFTFELI